MSFYFVYLLPLFLISFLFNTQQVFKTWIKTQVCTVQEPLVNIDVNQVYVIGKQINYIWLVSNEIANENQRKSYKSRHHIAVSAVVWRKERKEKIVDCETKVTIRKQTIKKVDSIQVYRKSERFFFLCRTINGIYWKQKIIWWLIIWCLRIQRVKIELGASVTTTNDGKLCFFFF